MKIHIGQKIAEVLEKRGMTKRSFAEKINMGERNLYALFKRPSIDTAQLEIISEALGYDFFALYSRKDLEEPVLMEPREAYGKGPINLTFRLDGNGEKSAHFLAKMNDVLSEFLEEEKAQNSHE